MNKYEIRVDGRLYEVSRGDERKDEIMPILESIYGKEHVTCINGIDGGNQNGISQVYDNGKLQ